MLDRKALGSFRRIPTLLNRGCGSQLARRRLHKQLGVGLSGLLILLLGIGGEVRAQEGEASTDSSAAKPRDSAREKFLRINYVFNRGHYDLAIPEYNALLKDHPKFKDRALVHYAVAIAHYQLAVKPSDSSKKSIELHLRSSVSHLQDALSSRRFKDKSAATRLLGQCRLQLGDHTAAQKAFHWVMQNGGARQDLVAARLGLAETFYEKGQYDQARELYERFLADADETVEGSSQDRARFYLAMSLYRMPGKKSQPEALRLFEIITVGKDQEHRHDARYMAALILVEAGEEKKALEHFKELVQSGDADYAELARFGLGSAYFHSNQYAAAEKTLSSFLEAFPQSRRCDEARELLARLYLQAGDTERAEKELRDLASSSSVGPQVTLFLARRLSEQSQGDEATKVLKRGLKQFADDPLRDELELELGLTHLSTSQLSAAVELFRGFVERPKPSPLLDHAMYLLAHALHRAGEFTESGAMCDRFATAYPESRYRHQVSQIAAENLFLAGDYLAAQVAYERLLAREESLGEVAAVTSSLRIAQALHAEKKYADARSRLEAITTPVDTTDPVLLSREYYLAECLYQTQEYAGASRHFVGFLKAVSLAVKAGGGKALRGAMTAQVADARFKLAHSFQLAGKLNLARTAYRRALKHGSDSPHRAQIYFELGQLHYQGKNLERASKSFTRLLKRHPESRFVPHALFFLGTIHYEREEYANAAKYYDRVTRDYPENSVARDAEYRLAMSLRAAGDPERAQATLEKFRQKYPDDSRLGLVLLEEAAAASKGSRPEEALEILGKLIENPRSKALLPRVYYEIAWCHRSLNRQDQAVEAYSQLLQTTDSEGSIDHATLRGIAQVELAELEFERENYEQAKSLLEQLATQEPPDPQRRESVLYRLCWCQYKLGESSSAQQTFLLFKTEFPKSSLYPELAYLVATSLLEDQRIESAATLFERIMKDFAGSREAELALVSLGECRLKEKKFDDAEKIFASFLESFPSSEVIHRAHFGIGWAHENRGALSKAIEFYRRVVSLSSTPTAARAQFQIGQCFVSEKNYQKAIVEFLKVAASYGYEDWRAKAILQTAGCFEALEDHQNSKKYYKEVMSSYPERDEAKLARERLRKLEIN